MTEFSEVEKIEGRRAYRNIFFFGLVFVTIWAVLLKFLPDGWWITGINIIAFLFSLIGIGLGSLQALRPSMPNWLAWVCALLTWFIIVILIRSLLLNLLGVI